MTAPIVLLAIDIATMVAFAFFGLRVATHYPKRRESWIIVLLCIATISHTALSRAEYGAWIEEPYRFQLKGAYLSLNVVRNMTPGLFAWLTSLVFTDRERQAPWLYALLGVQFLLECLRGVGGDRFYANEMSAWLQIVFAATAVYWTLAYWQSDLIEARRKARAVVSIILSVNTVASTILLRLIIPENSYANYQGHVVLSVFTFALALFLLWRLMDGAVGVPVLERAKKAGPAPEEIKRSEDDLTLKRLDALMRDQLIYRVAGLSIKSLADRVGVPEYRLRQVIHESLGYRNFNVFLHTYRISDAAKQLSDAQSRRLAILSIAESVGYESINTFNRAFRDLKGMSPTEFRKQAVPGGCDS